MSEIVYQAIVVLTFASAAIAIASKYLGLHQNAFYISKPLTTTLILVPVLILIPTSISAYIPLIAGGLLFALIGDILLMLPEIRFVMGIGSFAATHALYLAAFISAAGLALVNPSTSNRGRRIHHRAIFPRSALYGAHAVRQYGGAGSDRLA